MFENPRTGRQTRNFTTNVPKFPDLKSSFEQIFSENWRWVSLWDVLLFVASWSMFNSHIFRHEMFCYLFPHGRCFICIFSSMRCYLFHHGLCFTRIFFCESCFCYLFPHGRCFICIFSSMRCCYLFPHGLCFTRIFFGERCFCYLFPRDRCLVHIFSSGLKMYSGIRYLFYTLIFLLGHVIICCLCWFCIFLGMRF